VCVCVYVYIIYICCEAFESRIALNELRCTLKDQEERAEEKVAEVEAAAVRKKENELKK